MAKHGAKVATKQFLTLKVKGFRMRRPLIWMANYWGTLALSYPCEIFEEEDYFLVMMHHSKTHNYLKAFNSKGWDHAMVHKMDSILKNRTWSLVGLSLGKKLINVQWV